MIQVPLHENRAAIRGQGRTAVFGAVGELVQGAAQLSGLLFDEAAGARGAHRVHGGRGDPAILQGREFGVLAADLDDGVHPRVELAGRAGMGGDFVQYEIGADQPPDEFASGTGGAGTPDGQNASVPRGQAIDGFQDALHRRQRTSAGAGVKPRQDRFVGRHQDRLGTGGADVDPEKNRLLIRQGGVAVHLDRRSVPGLGAVGVTKPFQAVKIRIPGLGQRQGRIGIALLAAGGSNEVTGRG